jgi:3-oxoadipate CoA-transferase, beta subunit
MTVKPLARDEIARRVARDIPDGAYVNLGIGLPTLVANYVPSDREVVYHSENGILGMGPAPEPGREDHDLINAGKQPVTLVPGAAIFHHTDAFAMIRGGHIDLALLGGMQVAANGDLANWATGDEKFPPAVGGAMDLGAGAASVWVLMDHTATDGAPKILDRSLPPAWSTASTPISRSSTSPATGCWCAKWRRASSSTSCRRRPAPGSAWPTTGARSPYNPLPRCSATRSRWLAARGREAEAKKALHPCTARPRTPRRGRCSARPRPRRIKARARRQRRSGCAAA